MNSNRIDIIKYIGKRIQSQYWITLVSGLVIGMITHFFMLTNKIPNWDDITNYDSPGSQSFLGRWFLGYVHKIGGKPSAPAVHGFLMILALSLAACVVMRILELKSVTSAVLTAAIMVTFPSVACTMSFMFMAHTSGIAILMNCLAIYCFRRWKWGYVPGAVLIILALGIYQSYVSIAIALVLMGMITDLIHGKDSVKVAIKGIVSAATFGICVVIYKRICYIFYPSMADSEYGGIGEMGEMALSDIPINAGRAYKRFLEYFLYKPFEFVTKWMQRTNIIVCILAVIFFVLIVYTTKMWKDWKRLTVITVAAFFMPLAVAFVYFMAPEAPFSMLMLYAYTLIYVMVVALLEDVTGIMGLGDGTINSKQVISVVLSFITVVTLCINCHSNYLLTNKAYYRSFFAFERTEAYYNRIIAMLEQTEGYEYGDDVLIGGDFYYATNPAPIERDIFDSEALRTMDGVALENGMITEGVRHEFVETFIGFPMGYIHDDVREKIYASDEFREMPHYPKDGCIRKIEGVWVVKLEEEN